MHSQNVQIRCKNVLNQPKYIKYPICPKSVEHTPKNLLMTKPRYLPSKSYCWSLYLLGTLCQGATRSSMSAHQGSSRRHLCNTLETSSFKCFEWSRQNKGSHWTHLVISLLELLIAAKHYCSVFKA